MSDARSGRGRSRQGVGALRRRIRRHRAHTVFRPGGRIAHAESEIGDSVVIVEDASPYTGTRAPPAAGLDGTRTFLSIYAEDVDAVIERAAQLGATVKRPAQDQFYGDRDGFIVDPFGHGWTIASHVEDGARDEIIRRMIEFAEAG
jgi:PhnB protein